MKMEIHPIWLNNTKFNDSAFYSVFIFYSIVEISGIIVNILVLYYLIL